MFSQLTQKGRVIRILPGGLIKASLPSIHKFVDCQTSQRSEVQQTPQLQKHALTQIGQQPNSGQSANLRFAATEDLLHLLSPRQLRHSDQLVQRHRRRHSLCDQPLQDIGRQIAQPHQSADKPI